MIFLKSAEERCAAFFLKKTRKALRQIAKGKRHGSIYDHNDIFGWRGSVKIITHRDGEVCVELVLYDSWIPLHKVYETLQQEGCRFDRLHGEEQTPVQNAAGRDDMFILDIYLGDFKH